MYLRPLVEELLQLWRDEGVRVWDEARKVASQPIQRILVCNIWIYKTLDIEYLVK